MRTLFLFFGVMLTLCLPAHAAPYDISGENLELPDWAIKRTTAPPQMGSESFRATLLMGFCGDTTNCDASVGTFVSSWSKVSCNIVVETPGALWRYEMVFSSDSSGWPSTWPSSVSCTRTVSGETMVATADLVADSDGLWGFLEAKPGSPASASTPFEFKLDQHTQSTDYVQKVRQLSTPSATTTNIADAVCKKADASDWTGVTVSAFEGVPEDWVKVKVTGKPATCSTGCYCRIQRNGSNVDIPVKLSTF